MRDSRFLLLLAVAAAVVGCSSVRSNDAPPKAAAANAASKTPQLEPGREALQKMYASARLWAPDAQPLGVASNPRPGDHRCQATVWSAKFASAGKRSIRSFMWSGATGPDAPDSGISQGSIDVYSPENASTRPFDMNYLKVDSDQVYTTAQKHGGSALLKKSPDIITQCELLWDPRQSRLLWRVSYLPQGGQARLNVVVNASTGQFVRVE